ncbi:uncharacterized protein LOC129263060 [Lytechinus pictus]|uniref:uncharacterized protein LOC129263060 n=1 Tax=Lytechinus pictus TaxID=7653 RepID=UPI00240DCDEF|nr:uncharacterized protein LOC129263060 [Lytechinus pictus]
MAYVYSNAIHVSIALLLLGLIQIALEVSCFFGCYAGYQYTYASPGWSGVLAFLTGVFGICMVRYYKEMILGKCFFIFSLLVLFASAACLFLVAFFAWRAEYALAYDAQERARRRGRSEKLVATGLAIHTCVLCVGVCLLISSCYASWLNCCCEKAPTKKGYGLALEPVRVAHGTSHNRLRESP